MEGSVLAPELGAEARRSLPHCSRVVLFDDRGGLLYSSCTVLPGELQQLAGCFADRDAAVQQGLRLEGRRYEVHRHHPPLVYGRSMADCEPETSTGIAVCRVDSSRLPGGVPAYVAATWEQPHTSARVVPRVADFARQQLAAAGAAPT
ncbi:hypothetical protein ABPG77_005254 [Micractinium sp. CCAP 211/92]